VKAIRAERSKVKGERLKGKKLCASVSSVRDKKDVFTAETQRAPRLNELRSFSTKNLTQLNQGIIKEISAQSQNL
jgi:hypothetical protein